MTKPRSLPAPKAISAPQHACPFSWSGHCEIAGETVPVDNHSADARYTQVRRQGIYLAACIVDDVAAMGIRTPEAVIDEIRRRICELVRCELRESPRK